MRYFLLIIITMMLIGCGGESSIVEDEANLFITVEFPSSPLITTIRSCRIAVTGGDLATALEKSEAIELETDADAVVSMYVPAGDDRLINIYFSQQSGAIIYWSNLRLDISADSATEVSADAIQAAASSASRIKVFRDTLPWNSQALDDVLVNIGITLGTDENQYQIISSETFDTISLTVGEDMVIIANDQNQQFYDNYYSAQDKINAFITDGGTIFWEACDLGWAQGSITEAGITLPGGAGIVSGYENHNYLTSTLWQLTEGLDSTLIGNYASHEGFINLPEGALAYTVDGRNLPTLVSFNYGIGWVILSGQPLEYSYDRVDSLNCGDLLPRILSYVLGLDFGSSAMPKARYVHSDLPSLNSKGD